jgi:hypothetical protein
VVIEPNKPFMETRQGSADDAAPAGPVRGVETSGR